MRALALVLFLLPTNLFALEISTGGSIKFQGDRFVVNSGKRSFQNYYIGFDLNDEDSGEILTGMLLLNAEAKAGKKIQVPDSADKLKAFLKSYSQRPGVLCDNKEARSNFIEMVEPAIKSKAFDELNNRSSSTIVAPELKSPVAR